MQGEAPVLLALGTRAELIKMAPVMRSLAKRKIPYYFLHTGQHYVHDLAKTLGVKAPDESLEIPAIVRGRFGVATLKALWWDFKTVVKMWRVLRRVKPKLVLVHGDTMTTAAVSLAVRTLLFNRPRLGHVEAGIRSENLREPWPEELSRRITDFCSDYLFAPTPRAQRNLSRWYYRGKKVFVTGNTNVDVLLANLPASKRSRFRLPPKPYVFSQIHRQETIRSPARSRAFLDVLRQIPRPVVFILLENTRDQLEKFGMLHELMALRHVRPVQNLPYHDFLKAFSNSACIFTDGGGQTEEATTLRIPCVVFRRATERQEAEESGAAVRVGEDSARALELIEKGLRGEWRIPARASRAFGDGHAGERIAREVEGLLKGS